MHAYRVEPLQAAVRAATVAVVFAAMAGTASADAPLFVSYENLNYAGSVTRYSTFADATNQTNALSSATIATATKGSASTLTNARDGQIFVGRTAPGYYTPDYAYFSTSWYFTEAAPNYDGWGNPNNANDGFIQFDNYGSLATTVNGGWSGGGTIFTVNLSGGDGDSDNLARLWAPEGVGGPAGDTGGVFRSFDLNMVATFASAATLNGSTGWLETGANPTALTGTVSGIFENQSTTDTTLQGFYAFNFALANGSWATNAGATYGDGSVYPAVFAAPIPEPEAYALAFAGLAMVGIFGARRRRAA